MGTKKTITKNGANKTANKKQAATAKNKNKKEKNKQKLNETTKRKDEVRKCGVERYVFPDSQREGCCCCRKVWRWQNHAGVAVAPLLRPTGRQYFIEWHTFEFLQA